MIITERSDRIAIAVLPPLASPPAVVEGKEFIRVRDAIDWLRGLPHLTGVILVGPELGTIAATDFLARFDAGDVVVRAE